MKPPEIPLLRKRSSACASVTLVAADHAVDKLAHDVDVPGMPGGVFKDVDHGPPQRDRIAEHRGASLVKVDTADQLVGRRPGPAVEGQDVGGAVPRLDPDISVVIALPDQKGRDGRQTASALRF
jgi:hypothetical protein